MPQAVLVIDDSDVTRHMRGRILREAVWVRDNKIGFDPSQAERIFQPLEKLPSAIVREGAESAPWPGLYSSNSVAGGGQGQGSTRLVRN